MTTPANRSSGRKANWSARRRFLPCRLASGTIPATRSIGSLFRTLSRRLVSWRLCGDYRARRHDHLRPQRRRAQPGRHSDRHGGDLSPGGTIAEVLESVVVAQQWQGDVRVVLFVRLRDGLTLDDGLGRPHAETRIRRNATPRHVPARRSRKSTTFPARATASWSSWPCAKPSTAARCGIWEHSPIPRLWRVHGASGVAELRRAFGWRRDDVVRWRPAAGDGASPARLGQARLRRVDEQKLSHGPRRPKSG